MILEIIRDVAGLAAFEAEWSCFVETADGATPFHLPEWLITWWRHFGSGQLRVLVFRQKSTLAGVIPCFLHEWNGLRQLTLLGSGVSDYLEPLFTASYRDEAVAQLQGHLAASRDWDVCVWQDLLQDTKLRELAASPEFDVHVKQDEPCKVLPLRGAFKTYWGERSKSLRQNVRRDLQKAQSRGRVQFEVLTEARPDVLRAVIELHTARWQERGCHGAIAANHSAEFLENIAREFALRNVLRLFCLKFEDKISAAILAFAYRGTLYDYVTAFDPELGAIGIGRTLLYESIRYAFANGYAGWDFMRGDEPYKSWWGAGTVPKCRLKVTRRDLHNPQSSGPHGNE